MFLASPSAKSRGRSVEQKEKKEHSSECWNFPQAELIQQIRSQRDFQSPEHQKLIMGMYWYFQHLLLDTASIHTARYNCAHSKAYHPEREMFYLVGKQSLRVLLKVTHQFSGRVDHSVNLSSQFSSSAVNHHLNSARKELIYFTPSFNLTNGVDA